MPITNIISDSLDRSFSLYRDLIDSVDEAALSSKLPSLPSNTLGLQLWCVVGARESYTRAIMANQWAGFTCSLETATLIIPVAEALSRSAQAVSDVLKSIETYTDVQNRLIIDLLEHEAAHHGQLIRYLYALKLSIPSSWKSRYSLA
ncbi:hypothetical protein [Prosthecobacter dejongeii]|uniref:DinB family protein n=1 Tax=Prosthecobacter dejongeii TaxID=48465 RepID=A0A7W7YQJ0_9BACT|nr:hypothetical protein [Prosthecobacter dejongeii]MBB5040496.1 hypothetical protein [Prosthecobacter dejongeii]